MPADPPITDLLNKVQQHLDDRAITDIYDYFIGMARSLAKSRLGAKLQGKVTASSIALEAFSNSVQHVQNSATIESREDFRRMLAFHVNIGLSNAAQRFGAQKRDVAREEAGAHDIIENEQGELGPSAKAIADELAVNVVQHIFEHEKNESKRAICLLGILLEYPAKTIREMIKPLEADRVNSDQGGKTYAIRTIELTIQKRWKQLVQEFGEGVTARHDAD